MNVTASRLRCSRPFTNWRPGAALRPTRIGLASQFIQPFTGKNLVTEFSGLTLMSTHSAPTERRLKGFIVEANAKDSLGSRTGVGTKRKRRRVSGFRTRMRTPGGRRVLKRRRKKGRKILCPASIRPDKERFTNKY